jgi:hypothetical protein
MTSIGPNDIVCRIVADLRSSCIVTSTVSAFMQKALIGKVDDSFQAELDTALKVRNLCKLYGDLRS